MSSRNSRGRLIAIETSCDETTIAIADFRRNIGRRVDVRTLSHIISSQAKLHAKFGGVVPNLAKREHQKNLPLILIQALTEGGFLNPELHPRSSRGPNYKQIPKSKLQEIEKILERERELLTRFKKYIVRLQTPEIDAIAVTYGPGLAPALWVGVNFARALAHLWDKPLIPTNHMEGHLFSALLQKSGKKNFQFSIFNFQFPALALLVSGGHTELVLMRGYGDYQIIGETLDDAAGEAFDKVARILGLGYPGGPEISRLAAQGDPRKYPLPSPMISTKDYNFSFSGLKTAALYLTKVLCQTKFGTKATLSRRMKAHIAASFEKAVVDVLVKKTIRAAKEFKAKTLLLGGGVAANDALRKELSAALKKEIPHSKLLLPDLSLTGDNALMIAAAAYFSKKKMAWSETLQADANVTLYEGTTSGLFLESFPPPDGK